MDAHRDLFAEFPPISREAWLAQITKDLKDKPLASMHWPLPGGIAISPFERPQTVSTPGQPSNQWLITEHIRVEDPVAANRQALDALEGGAEALSLRFDQPLSKAVLEALFDNIYLDYIQLEVSGSAVSGNPGAFFALLDNYIAARSIRPESLKGTLAYQPAAAALPDWRFAAEMGDYVTGRFPHFRWLEIPVPDAPEALGSALVEASKAIEQLEKQGFPAAKAAESIFFSVAVGKSYFLEIGRLRALEAVWYNLLKAWNIPATPPFIQAGFQTSAYDDALYTNMIRATTMAMSAVLGGVQSLSVRPYDEGREAQSKYPATFARRIARNVQHLLKMESGLDQLPDPTAGSYYIETISTQLAEKAWAELQQSA